MPVLVSFSFAPNEEDKAAALVSLAAHADVAALGVNCGREQSPADVASTLRVFRKSARVPLFARPNAGSPTFEDNRWVYRQAPNEWARQTMDVSDLAMLGGCCGTTPVHIRELRRLLDAQKKNPA